MSTGDVAATRRSDARTTAARTACRLVRLAVMAVVFLAGLDATQRAGAVAPGSTARLEQLLAPIALYPDALLAQILMASTYPLEVVEAARWAQANAGVSAEALEDAMQQQPWDASVKGLTALPQVLQMMNENIDWTQALGDALLAQQRGVLDAVQRLRARAAATGALQTMPRQRLVKVAAPPEPGSSAAAATVYVIEPMATDEYAVPIYDPGTMYAEASSSALSFAGVVTVGPAIWGLLDWWQHRINISISRFNRFNHTKLTRITWTHDPAHRGSVPYPAGIVASQFGDAGRETTGDKGDTGRPAFVEHPKPGGAKPKAAKSSTAKSSAAKSGAAKTKAAKAKAAPTSRRAYAQHRAGSARAAAQRHTRRR
jgi:hypothetical protein